MSPNYAMESARAYPHVDGRSVRFKAEPTKLTTLASTMEYTDVEQPQIKLPKRPRSRGYVRPPHDDQRFVPDHAATLLE